MRTKDSNSEVSRRRILAAGAAGLATLAAPSIAGAIATKGSSADPTGPWVLITGCSSGFGRLTALHLARNGWNTVASMRHLRSRNAPEARELRALAEAEKLPLHVVEIDVSRDDSVERGVSQALEITQGRLDVLVNNAAFSIPGPSELIPMDQFERLFQTNLFGCHRMARAVLPTMRSQKTGYLIQISSGTGRVAFPRSGLYSASKWALEGLSAAMRVELAPLGVEVTVIQPDSYPTPFAANTERNWELLQADLAEEDQARMEAYTEQIRRARISRESNLNPQDIADTILRLVQMEKGSRPFRQPVGSPVAVSGLNQINQVSEGLDRAFLSMLGYGDWVRGAR